MRTVLLLVLSNILFALRAQASGPWAWAATEV
jgi:hypothetical protein